MVAAFFGAVMAQIRKIDNDFSSSNYIRINAIADGDISGLASGHAFVSMYKNSTVINTFSAWNTILDSDNSNTYGKVNNIAEYDNFFVDKQYDWDRANNSTAYGYRIRTASITKTHSDWVRFGNGYRIHYFFKYAGYNFFSYTCANASSDLWNLVIDGGVSATKVPYTNFPQSIYNTL